jgi:hypothetical protein
MDDASRAGDDATVQIKSSTCPQKLAAKRVSPKSETRQIPLPSLTLQHA